MNSSRPAAFVLPGLVAALTLLATTGPATPSAAAGERTRDLTKDPASRPNSESGKDDKGGPKDGPKESAGETRTLLGGAYQFRPPEGWVEAANAAKDDTAAYAWPEHDSALAVQILPADAKFPAGAAGKIVQSLRATRQKNKEPIVLAPTVQKDPRFLLKINEKYKTGEKRDTVADQLHLYRAIGPRVVMVTVNTTAASEDDVKAALNAGEDAAASVTYRKK